MGSSPVSKPLYAFAYGLSYTTFKYSDLDISPSKQNSLAKISFNASKLVDENDLVNVSFTVTNTGKRAGAEVAQLYVGQENSTVDRPIKELKGFKKVYLQPGQSQTVTLALNQRSFAYWDEATQKWIALPGTYNVLVGGVFDAARRRSQRRDTGKDLGSGALEGSSWKTRKTLFRKNTTGTARSRGQREQ
jgi:beta-glucosidase